MAVTLANVSTPNQTYVQGEILGLKAVLMDVTFDNSYATAGESVTASQLNLNTIEYIFPFVAKNAAGTAVLPGIGYPSGAGKLSALLQLYRYDGASAGKASLEEAAAAFDASLFTARVLVLGT